MIKKTFGLFTAILFSCVTSNVQAQNSEKEFIKENMEFAAKQYNLMLKTPSQGKNGSGVKTERYPKEAFTYGQPVSFLAVYGISLIF